MSDADDPDTYAVEVGLNRNLGAALRVAPEASESGAAVVEHTLGPGKLAAPLHRHRHEDEISFVLEGTMGVQEGRSGGRDSAENAADVTVSTVEAGEFAVKGRGRWHTFWNPGPDPLRFFEIIAPGAFARYFEEVAAILPENESDAENGPDSENESDAENGSDLDEETARRLGELHADYGFEIDPESVPALLDRHGLDG